MLGDTFFTESGE